MEKYIVITNKWFKNLHSEKAEYYSSIFKNCLDIITTRLSNLNDDDLTCFASYIAFLITENIKEENDIYFHINELCVEYSQNRYNNKKFFYNAFHKYLNYPRYNYNQKNIILAIYDKIYYLLKNNFKILLRTFPIIKNEFLKILIIIIFYIIYSLIYPYINLPILKYIIFIILILALINTFITGDVKVQIDKLDKIRFERYTLVFQYLNDKCNDMK